MSHRIAQVNELIRHELSQLILKEIDFPKDCLVTITKVETTNDLEFARVWLSILPNNLQGKIFKIMQRNTGHLQYLLNKKLIMRKAPKINFIHDTTEEKATRIDEILDKIQHEV